MPRVPRFFIIVLVLSSAAFGQNLTKISQNSGGFPGILADSDIFGQAIAPLGDVNGDGFEDIAVGAHFDDSGGFSASGSVHVLFLNGLGGVLSSQKIAEGIGGFAGQLGAGDNFGAALAAVGDLDGNGVTDLAVGAWLDDDGGSNRGAVYILFLSTSGTVIAHQKISSTVGGFTATLDNDDNFGNDVAALGDLDGDGIPDLAVGATKDDDGGTNLGAVYVIFLNANGTVKGHQKISATSGGLNLPISGTRFGLGLSSTSDINQDGLPELIVGSPLDIEAGASRGAVYVLFLTTTGVVSQGQKITGTQGGFTVALDSSDQFGNQLAGTADLNGDSVPDLLVGAPGDDDGGPDRGAVYVLHLTASGTVTSHAKISSSGGLTGLSLDDGDGFGRSVAWIGGSSEKYAVGAPFDDDGGTDRGAVYVVAEPNAASTVPGLYPTIQAAINALPTGSEITVAPGTYNEHSLNFGGKDLVLKSLNGPYQTIIDAQNLGRVFVFQGGESSASIIAGFTIKNGRLPTPILQAGAGGGGVLIQSASPQFRRCIFEGNRGGNGSSPIGSGVSKPGGGGGAVRVEGGSPSFQFCVFTGNRGGDGSASSTQLFLTSTGGTGGVGGAGGALYVASGAVTLLRCTLANNFGGNGGNGGPGAAGAVGTAGGNGGTGGAAGAGAIAIAGGTVQMVNTIVWGNLAGIPGNGGVGGAGSPPGSPGAVGASAPDGVLGTPSYVDCNVQGVAGAVDPQFEDANNRNYHLLATSPLIGLGNGFFQLSLPGGFGEDLDGEPGQISGADVGADEFMEAPNFALTPSLALLGTPVVASMTGSGLAAVTKIFVNNLDTPFVHNVGGFLNNITFTIPPQFVPGSAVIGASFGYYSPTVYTLTSTVQFPFQITLVTPSGGPVSGGTPVSITGPGLGAATNVRIGSTSVAFTVVNSSTLQVTTPPAPSGQTDVSAEFGAYSVTAAGAFTYGLQLQSLSATSGPLSGGGSVTLNGINLGSATGVTFGGVPATTFVILSSTQIVAIVPPGFPGPADVTVHAGGESSTLIGAYTYEFELTSVAPAMGPIAGGTVVTLVGVELASATGVSFGSVPASSIQVINTSTLEVIAPAHPAGLISVSVHYGAYASTLPGAFDYLAPRILNVPSAYATPYDAVAAAYSGDTIQFGSGAFYLTAPINPLGKNLLFRGATTGQATILDGGFQSKIVEVNSGEGPTTEFTDIVFRHGRSTSGGSAVDIANSSPRFVRCQFLRNTMVSSGSGGAVRVVNGEPRFADCQFTENVAGLSSGGGFNGGAVSIQGGSSDGTPRFVRCLFLRNSIRPTFSANGHGGAINCEGSSLEVDSCEFIENKAGDVPADNFFFTNAGNGGAIRTLSGPSRQVTIRNCIFLSNKAGNCDDDPFNLASAGHGGALSLSSIAQVRFCTFYGNESGRREQDPPQNVAGIYGIAVPQLPAITVEHCVLWGQVGPPLSANQTLVANFCNIEGGFPGVGNQSVDPMFVNPAALDFRLQPGSPCVDAGNSSATQLPPLDLAGSPRLMGAVVDLGAYEAASILPAYPGTGDDLALSTLVNGLGVPGQGQKVAAGGDTVYVHLGSPQGAYVGDPYFIVGDAFLTGSPPASFFPGVHINLFTYVLLRDGLNPLPGGLQPQLPASGIGFSLQVPPALSGVSFMLQGAVLTPLSNNGFVAITDGHEIQLFPSL